MSRELILKIASEEVGTKESPKNSNLTKYGAWYGFDGYAWCAMFVSWVYHKAGDPLGKINDDKGYRSCQSGYNHWRASGELTSSPRPGDIVLYDWEGDGKCDHTGIFVKWITQNKKFYAYEGNTAFGNNSDGGEVMYRPRFTNNVKAFVSPIVLGENISPVSLDLKKGDISSIVLELQKLLTAIGYKVLIDGDFGAGTEKAVKQFQKDKGLIADGIVTPALRGLMEETKIHKSSGANRYTSGSYLKLGATGNAVAILQEALSENGYDTETSGVFDKKTGMAIKNFQKDHRLKPDGIAGPETFAALKIKSI
ncbi:endolysin [Leptospira kobayashii]|uniref:Endolysin n=1 Tax=Leptospira kobayashii TaxID=1917830 RepID=A0ABM7UIB1_9LEPT|nr:peptidoglycan-binding protein [Leptospira kobayashii]BDA78473.1 endolysin [Leptospira kobayashii]